LPSQEEPSRRKRRREELSKIRDIWERDTKLQDEVLTKQLPWFAFFGPEGASGQAAPLGYNFIPPPSSSQPTQKRASQRIKANVRKASTAVDRVQEKGRKTLEQMNSQLLLLRNGYQGSQQRDYRKSVNNLCFDMVSGSIREGLGRNIEVFLHSEAEVSAQAGTAESGAAEMFSDPFGEGIVERTDLDFLKRESLEKLVETLGHTVKDGVMDGTVKNPGGDGEDGGENRRENGHGNRESGFGSVSKAGLVGLFSDESVGAANGKAIEGEMSDGIDGKCSREGCQKGKRFNSIYCSDICGVKVAQERLKDSIGSAWAYNVGGGR